MEYCVYIGSIELFTIIIWLRRDQSQTQSDAQNKDQKFHFSFNFFFGITRIFI